MITEDVVEFMLEDILGFHEYLEHFFVMEPGVMDMGLLESAVNAPFQCFAGEDLYPTIFDKAARLFFGLVKNHAFYDGNKRVAIHSTYVFLGVNGVKIDYTEEEMEAVVINVATDKMLCEGLSSWIESKVV